jgi:hypothetical protein
MQTRNQLTQRERPQERRPRAARLAYEGGHKPIVRRSGREKLRGHVVSAHLSRWQYAGNRCAPNLLSIPVEPFTFPLDITVWKKFWEKTSEEGVVGMLVDRDKA